MQGNVNESVLLLYKKVECLLTQALLYELFLINYQTCVELLTHVNLSCLQARYL